MMMPMVQGKSCAKTIHCVIFLVVLICITLAIIFEYRGDEEEAFINVLADPSNGEINENLVALLWVECRQELNGLFEPKLRRLQEILSNVIRTVGYSLAEENIRNMARHPAIKQALSNCIRKNDFMFRETIKDGGFNPWYTRYVNSLHHRRDVPRRILSLKNTAAAPGSISSPSPSPSSTSPGSASASSPDSEAPDFSPTPRPSPLKSPASSPALPLPKPSNSPPPVHAAHHGDEYTGIKKIILVIACIVTSVVTASVSIFFFFLCFRKQIIRRPISGGETNHDYQSLGNESSPKKKASTNAGIALKISSDGKSSLGAVAGAGAGAAVAKASAESSNTSGNTNSNQPLGEASTSVPGVTPENAPPSRPEPPNPVKANPPAPPLPGPLPPPKPLGAGPPPPAPPCAPPRPAPPMPPGSKGPKPSNAPQHTPNAPSGEGSGNKANASKAKLKPFFWDKVAAKPDHAMVWNQIKAGSFQFNEDLIETLFGYSAADKKNNDDKKEPFVKEHAPQFVQLIDPKKAQNLAILLRALNVTAEDVCAALWEGNDLPVELLQTLLKMAPTSDEEHKIKTYTGEICKLGSSEQFLKQMLGIPFAFKRIEVMLFMCSINEEAAATKVSFETLEVACSDLRGSRLFRKLLEAVLKTGNRMNDGTFRGGAKAIKLDTLLKLSDVKGVDGKTTLLHFVVQEIIRSEGLKAVRTERESGSFTSIKSDDLLDDVPPDIEERYHHLGFQAVSRLSTELESVKNAAAVDAENLTGTVARLEHSLLKARNFLNSEMKSLEEDSGFHRRLKSFVERYEVEITSLLEEEKRIMELVKNTGSYFHGANKKDEGLRLFVVVRDFLIILDKVCKEVKNKQVKSNKEGSHSSSSSRTEAPDLRQMLFPAIAELRVDSSSSDEDN